MHQPNYLPWIGLFSKISQGNCFIIYDTAQYVKSSVINRNLIRTPVGSSYLTIPVGKCPVDAPIAEITLPENKKWREEHWQAIYQNYVKTRYFGDYRNFFEALYQEDLKYLWQVNEKIILFLLKCFDIKVEVFKTSNMETFPNLYKTDLMIAYLKSAGTEIYLSGPSGKNYLEFEKFPQNNIGLKYVKFQHPVYKQRYPGFETNLSAIDLLFNKGPEAGRIVREAGGIEEEEYANSKSL
jgi:hypothetical protein